MRRTGSLVIVFARAPQPGAAKTRLIPLLGRDGAAALHARLVEHTLATAARAGLSAVELHGTPSCDRFLSACATRHGATLKAQVEGDLGERMYAAAVGALAKYDGVILIGSDCPALEPDHLRTAARLLEEGRDTVLAPADDGGYALIALARCDKRLFDDVSWSTGAVMDETRSRLRNLGWRWHELETLWDVDRPLDYHRLIESGLLKPPAGTQSL
jgi:hypothetical protein